MNVLFVTEKLPYPLDTGGNVRSYHLLRGLAQQHHVTLLSATEAEVPEEYVEHLRGLCKQVIIARVGAGSFMRDAMALVTSAWRGTPLVLERHRRTAMAKALAGAFVATRAGDNGPSSQAIDCVYFNHLDAALYLDAVPPRIRLVLDQHNVVSNQLSTSLVTESNLVRRWVLMADKRRLAKFEVATVNAMDCCLVCSGTDADALLAMGARMPPRVIPNGVDTSYFQMSPRQPGDMPKLVFVGTLDYDPCEKAVWFFCGEILPLLRKTLPDIRFVAVGRNPSTRLRKLAEDDPAIILTGRVPDVRPHMQDASVFVVPLLSGSGTRLKILESMAAGIPVVSTTIGAEGLDVADGRHLWIADEPEAFAERVVRLVRNAEEAERMRREARALIEHSYSWVAIHRELEAAMESMRDPRARRAGIRDVA